MVNKFDYIYVQILKHIMYFFSFKGKSLIS